MKNLALLLLTIWFLIGSCLVSAQEGPQRVPITAESVGDMVEMARLEQGSLLESVWTPNGDVLYVIGSLGIWRFDVDESRDPPQLLDQYRGPLAVSPDGTMAVSMNRDGDVVLWETQTGQLIRLFYRINGVRLIWVTALEFSPDGSQLAIGYGGGGTGNPGGVDVWDIAAGKEIVSLRGGIDDVGAVAFTPDGTSLIAGGYSGLAAWDTTSWVRQQTPYGSYIDAVDVSADSQWIAFDSGREFAMVPLAHRDGQGWESVPALPTTDYPWVTYTAFAFNPVNPSLLVTSSHEYLQIWDVTSQTELARIAVRAIDVVFSPNGTRLALVDGRRLRIYDVETRAQQTVFDDFSAWIGTIMFSANGDLLAYERAEHLRLGWSSDSVRVWDTATFSGLDEITPDTDLAQVDLPFIRDHVRIESYQYEWAPEITRHIVRLLPPVPTCPSRAEYPWDSEVFAPIHEAPPDSLIHGFQGHEFPVDKICFSPSERWVVTSDRPNYGQAYPADARYSVRAWDAATGQQMALLIQTPFDIMVRDIVFDRDERWLGVVGWGAVTIWDTGNWLLVNTLEHGGGEQLIFAVDDMVIIRDHWGDISFWDAQNNSVLGTIEDLHIINMLLSPDGTLLALVSNDGTVRIWGVPSNIPH